MSLVLSGITWQTTPGEALQIAYDAWYTWMVRVIEQVMLARAPEIEAWMKENAFWQDRTGNARQTLYTDVVTALHEVVLLMAHGMDYGIYLETMGVGVYAIVGPALDVWLPVILDDLRHWGFEVQ